tara:strand:+ start:1235 stop:1408 length:174 start_codon:yes stop_codon:yes gene_type:complete
MHEPTTECPAWINAPDDATAQLFREVIASYMESERRLRENPLPWHPTPRRFNITDRD